MDKRQLEKYFCSTFLKDIGEKGQEKLLNSKVLIIGVGGLGSYVLPILASSGVGHIGIIDFDKVELDNLPRQTLYREEDVGKIKVEVAKERVSKINKDVSIISYNLYLNKDNGEDIFKDYDIIIDCTDNFESKFVINDLCLKINKPFVSAGVSDYKGQILTVIPHHSSDFKSLFDELPLEIEEKYKLEDRGVFPSAVSIIANLSANEVLKYLLNIGELLTDTLLVVDTLKNNYEKIKLK